MIDKMSKSQTFSKEHNLIPKFKIKKSKTQFLIFDDKLKSEKKQ